jgi:hypothetical protein
MSDEARNASLEAKEQAQVAAGSSGMLVWNWVPTSEGGCTYDVAPSDPLLSTTGTVG